MAKQSSHVLKMLMEIADKEVEIATQSLADAMKIADEAQAKYDLLVEYRKEYGQNLSASLETGIGARAFQNFHGFFGKLDVAVKGQLEMLESAKHFVQVQKKRWKESQRKKLSYEVLIERQASNEAKSGLKKDQKMMDEFAMRTSRQSRP